MPITVLSRDVLHWPVCSYFSR